MGPQLDITSTEGFVQHLYQTCRLSKGSGMLVAPVCSTFVYMNLSYPSNQTFLVLKVYSRCVFISGL